MCLLALGAVAAARATSDVRVQLVARVHPSGFPQAHDTYKGMGAASDGRIHVNFVAADGKLWFATPQSRNIQAARQ